MQHDTAQDSHILIVDDQPANVALLEALLGEAGYTAIRAVTDPRTSVIAFKEFGPDLVVLDLIMPHLDGFAVMAQLRPLVPPESFLPILVLTADIAPEVRRRALAAGATDFLSKPLDTAEVLLRIGNLLHTRRLHLQVQRQNEALEERVRERTRELEEARSQVIELYRELAARNAHLQEMIERLVHAYENDRRSEPPSPAPRLDVMERLTPREHDVLRHLARGMTNAEIAAELVVSTGTVKFHVENIIAKLGVSDRTQAAVRAVEHGLLRRGD